MKHTGQPVTEWNTEAERMFFLFVYWDTSVKVKQYFIKIQILLINIMHIYNKWVVHNNLF